MLERVIRIARRLYFGVLFAPRGIPIPAAEWDLQYRRGKWDYLYSLEVMAHYMVVVGYAYYLRRSPDRLPSILDVGCGQGRLLELLKPYGFQTYHGIDLSSEAIKKAESLAIANASFEVADFEAWEATRRFDLIIFNEVFGYASRPVEVLLRYGSWLETAGVMIVSMYRKGTSGSIWNNLFEHFAVISSTTVENAKGQTWDIRVLRPKVA